MTARIAGLTSKIEKLEANSTHLSSKVEEIVADAQINDFEYESLMTKSATQIESLERYIVAVKKLCVRAINQSY